MKQIITIILAFWALKGGAQDERYFRHLVIPESNDSSITSPKGNFKTTSPFYELHLTDNPSPESIVFEKVDGLNWIHFFDFYKKKVFSYKLESNGFDAKPLRLRLYSLSNRVKVVVLYFYEGKNKAIDFLGQGRAYFFTIEDNNIHQIYAYKSSYFLIEKKVRLESMIFRSYDIHFEDLNKDGIKEIIFNHNLISRIYLYRGKGNWDDV